MVSVNDRGIVGVLAQVVIFGTELDNGAELFLVCRVKLLSSRESKGIVCDWYLNKLSITSSAAEAFRRWPELSDAQASTMQ